jgi:hypothetical protein
MAERVDYGSPDGVLITGAATDKVGFYGTTPVVQGATAAAGTDAATTQTLANALKVALDNLGIVA